MRDLFNNSIIHGMTRSTRSGGVELFRCILMFLIVLYHSWYYGLFGYEHGAYPIYSYWTLLFSAFILWHVDGFVAISGWFGIRFTLKVLGVIWCHTVLE